MAITIKPRCDFVVYTYFMNREDIHIQSIFFDPAFWEALKKKLLDFYLYAMVPEQLTGRVKRGIPMYPNIFSYKWLKIITPGNNVYRFKNYAKSWLSSMPADIYVITEISHRFVNLILRLFTHLALQERCELTGDFLKVAFLTVHHILWTTTEKNNQSLQLSRWWFWWQLATSDKPVIF